KTVNIDNETLSLHDALPILKPINLEKIIRVLERYLEEQPEDTAYIIVDVEGEAARLNLEDIIYIEANMGEITVVLIDQKLPLKIDRKSTRLNSSHVSISYAV